jgi:hypothetical protein
LLVALALSASGAMVLASLLPTQGGPSSRAQAGHGQARHGLDALPLAARGVVARALGADDRRWFAHRSAGGFVLGNRATGVRASFSRRDVIVRSGAVSWSLGLGAYGYGDRLRAVGPVSPAAHANRVVYRRDGVAEWYAGGPAGLEQGFTLAQPPRGPRAGTLALSIGRVPQGLTARVAGDHRGVVLAAGGRDLLRYGSLFASDQHGRSLPARIELSGGRLRLLIDDRGAAYPLRVDPLVQVAKLTASNGGIGDQLGYSIGVSGDGSTVVAGAPQANTNQGKVYVFTMPGTGWSDTAQTAQLQAFGGAAGDGFGTSVAISADGAKIAVGAPQDVYPKNTSPGAGAAYVFVRSGGVWSAEQTAALTASAGATDDGLGSSIAISGDGSAIASGAPRATGSTTSQAGAAYVFVQPGGGWGSGGLVVQHETAKLTASDGIANDSLGGENGGNAIAISSDGSTVAAGAAVAPFAPCPSICTAGPGAVYVFVRGGGWSTETQIAKLTASDGIDNDRFGGAVATSSDGSTIVAGARNATVGTNIQQGKVYAFVKPAGAWTSTSQQTAKLTAQDGNQQDALGRAVAISSDASTIIAGAYFATVGSNAAQGKVYIFARPGASWTTGTAQGELTAADGAPSDELGFSVATSSDASTVFAGARFVTTVGTNPAQGAQGAAYVFSQAVSNPFGPPPQVLPVSKPGSSGGGGGGGGAGGGAAPAVGGAAVSPSSFPAAPSGPSATASRKFGTQVTYTLSQAASVRFTVQQPQAGRKVKHGKKTTCDRPTTKNAKRKKCTRIVTLTGSFALTGVAGTNKFHFTGRLNGKRLAPGKYTLVVTPQANGKTGRAATVGFKIIR